MKAYFKKMAALLAAALLVLSMAACGGNDEGTSTEPDSTNPIVEEIPAEDTNSSEESESNAADSSETAKNEEESSNSSANSDSLSTDEAVALFNKAAASAKSMKGTRSTKVNLIDLPGGDTLKNIISKGLESSAKDVAITGVPNTTMNAGDFSSVKAVKDGNNWKLTLNVKNETAPNHAANTRAFEELPQSEIDSWINGKLKVTPSDSIKFAYNGGTIDATVTADGKLVSATYTMKVTVTVKNAKAMGLITISSAKVEVTQTDKF